MKEGGQNLTVFWMCVTHCLLSGLALFLLGVTGVDQHPNGSFLENLLTNRAVEITVGALLMLVSFALFFSNRKVFWVVVIVNLLAFGVSLAVAYEIGVYTVFGLGLLVFLPATVIWYTAQLMLLNRLRKGLWPS